MNTCTANLKGHEIQQKETQDMPNCLILGYGTVCWMIWIIINLNRVPARIKRLRRPLNEIFGIKQVRQISTSESEINSLFYYYLSIFYILE